MLKKLMCVSGKSSNKKVRNRSICLHDFGLDYKYALCFLNNENLREYL